MKKGSAVRNINVGIGLRYKLAEINKLVELKEVIDEYNGRDGYKAFVTYF